MLEHLSSTDKSVSDIVERMEGNKSHYNEKIYQDHYVADTLIASGMSIRGYDKMNLSKGDCIAVSTFPQDYDFGAEKAKYVCGMCVPPVMMAQIASAIYKQWFEVNANDSPPVENENQKGV